MKKTIIALLAVAGLASADSTVITFSTGGNLAGSYAYGVTFGDYSMNTHASQSTELTTEDAIVTVAAETCMYTTYTVYADPSNPSNASLWTNAAALSDMNTALGTSLTLPNLDALPMTNAGGNSWDEATLTIDFSSSYKEGDQVTLYLMLGSMNNSYSVTLGGLKTGYTMKYASAKGNGFDATELTQTARELTLVKVTGSLTKAATVTVEGDASSRNAFGMVAYSVASVPEPTTATLSLLALAGLAARRRRK